MSIRLFKPFGRRSAAASEMFHTVALTGPRPWLPMLGSLAAHGALLALLPLVTGYLAGYYDYDLDWSAFRAEPVRLRPLPDVLYYSPESKSGRRGDSGKSTGAVSAGEMASRPSVNRRFATATGLESPAMEPSETSVTILQPDKARETKESPSKLPALAFWARRNASTPKPRLDHILTPGRLEDAGPAPKMAAPPVLAVSNLETRAGDRNLAVPPPTRSPSLPVSNSTTAPIRDRTSDPQTGAFDSSSGEAVNVITLSAQQIQPGEVVTLPSGSHSARFSEHGAGAGGGSVSSTNAASDGKGAVPSVQGGSPIRDNSLAGDPLVARNSGASNSGAKLDGTSTSPILVSPEVAPVREPDAFTRIMHPPGGNFDVVVMQSNTPYDRPGVVGRLSGSPVYTVYLHVGDESEWALDFCLPPSATSNIGRYEVYVEASTPLSAPYPITTIVPKSIIGEARSTALVFHGLLTADGNFRDMQANERGISAERIASVLDQWRFRPAFKNKVAIEVEILLKVPVVSERKRLKAPIDTANN